MKVETNENRKKWFLIIGAVVLLAVVLLIAGLYKIRAKADSRQELTDHKLTISNNYQRQIEDKIYNNVMERLDDDALASVGQAAVAAYLENHQLPVSQKEKDQLMKLLVMEFDKDEAGTGTRIFSEEEKKELADTIRDSMDESMNEVEIETKPVDVQKKETGKGHGKVRKEKPDTRQKEKVTVISEQQLERIEQKVESDLEKALSKPVPAGNGTTETRIIQKELSQSDWERIAATVDQAVVTKEKIQPQELKKYIPQKGKDYFTKAEITNLKKAIAKQVTNDFQKEMAQLTRQIATVKKQNKDLQAGMAKLEKNLKAIDKKTGKSETEDSKAVHEEILNIQKEMETISKETEDLAGKLTVDGKDLTVIGLDNNQLVKQSLGKRSVSLIEYLKILSANDAFFAETIQRLGQLLPEAGQKTGQDYTKLKQELDAQMLLWKTRQEELEKTTKDHTGRIQVLEQANTGLKSQLAMQDQKLQALSRQLSELKEAVKNAVNLPGGNKQQEAKQSNDGGNVSESGTPGQGGPAGGGNMPGQGETTSGGSTSGQGGTENGGSTSGQGGAESGGSTSGQGGAESGGSTSGQGGTESGGSTSGQGGESGEGGSQEGSPDTKMYQSPELEVRDTSGGNINVSITNTDSDGQPAKYYVYAIRQDQLDDYPRQEAPTSIKDYGKKIAVIDNDSEQTFYTIKGLDKNAYYYICITPVSKSGRENTDIGKQEATYCLDTEDTSDYHPQPDVLEKMTWKQIAQIGAAGKADEYFRIGYEKKINSRYKVRILDFNHDELAPGDAHYQDSSYNDGRHAAYTFQFTDNVEEAGAYKLEETYYQTDFEDSIRTTSWYNNYYMSTTGVNADARYAYNKDADTRAVITYQTMTARSAQQQALAEEERMPSPINLEKAEEILVEAGLSDIRKVKKEYGIYNKKEDGENFVPFVAKSFVLSEMEVSGTSKYSAYPEGSQYQFYKEGGELIDGWLRSGSRNRREGLQEYCTKYNYRVGNVQHASRAYTGYAYALCKISNHVVTESYIDELYVSPAFCY